MNIDILGILGNILEAIWGAISGKLEELQGKLGTLVAFILDQEEA